MQINLDFECNMKFFKGNCIENLYDNRKVIEALNS